MMQKLKNKRVLVTGGGQGIGRAIVEEFLTHGCRVAIHYHSSVKGAHAIKAANKDIPSRVECFPGDLRIESEAEEMVGLAVKFLGGLDILVNNSGDMVARRYLSEVDMEFWRKVIDINMTSTMLVTRCCLPHLKKAGAPGGASIVNLSSLAGRKGGHPGSLVYSATKGAILSLTRALAAELGPDNIRVNAVAPGLILGTHFHDTHTTKESATETIRNIPLGRAGDAADVARAVVFLASEFDGFISAATLDINGGCMGF